MVNGPNLYEYVLSRPTVFADPTGTMFVAEDQDSYDAIQELEENPLIGSYIISMDADAETIFEVSPSTDPSLEYWSGAHTTLENDNYITSIFFLEIVDVDYPFVYGITPSLLQVIAHELGHAYFLAYEWNSSLSNDQLNAIGGEWAVYFENAASAIDNQRPSDVPNACGIY